MVRRSVNVSSTRICLTAKLDKLNPFQLDVESSSDNLQKSSPSPHLAHYNRKELATPARRILEASRAARHCSTHEACTVTPTDSLKSSRSSKSQDVQVHLASPSLHTLSSTSPSTDTSRELARSSFSGSMLAITNIRQTAARVSSLTRPIVRSNQAEGVSTSTKCGGSVKDSKMLQTTAEQGSNSSSNGSIELPPSYCTALEASNHLARECDRRALFVDLCVTKKNASLAGLDALAMTEPSCGKSNFGDGNVLLGMSKFIYGLRSFC